MCKKINLTHHQKTQYTNPALAKSSVRIGVLNNVIGHTTALNVAVFSYVSSLVLMVGLVGVSLTRRLSDNKRYANPASPIALKLAFFGDRLQKLVIGNTKMSILSTLATPVAQPTVFNFQSNNAVRIIQNAQGEPFFCLSDICKILTVDRTSELIRNLDKKGVVKNPTPTKGGIQNISFINEPNLYRVIFRSNKAEARQFQDWVFNEVLPAIRKTGSYTAPQQTAPTPEYINSNDWDNLKRLIWICEKEFNCKKSAGLAIWGRLREITGVKSPEKFEVKHLPILAQEFQRILSVIEHYSNIKYQTEKNLIKHILRNGQDEMLDLLMNEFAEKSQTFQEDLQKPLFNIFNTDCVKLLNRQ